MHSFSCESQFVAIELALLEELVEKCASIALQIAVTRDEASLGGVWGAGAVCEVRRIALRDTTPAIATIFEMLLCMPASY